MSATHSPTSNKTSCPANATCPFSRLIHQDDGEHLKSAAKQCPAFKKGCPFSHLSESEAKALLQSIPMDHKHCPALQSHSEELGQTTLQKHWLDVLTSCRLDLFSKFEEIHLSAELKQGTAKVHEKAHGLAFVQQILKCEIKMQDYQKLLESFYFIYSTLEEALHAHSQDPILQSLYFPDQLYRFASIVEDLQYYIAQNEGLTLSEAELQARLVPSPATRIYVDHLKTLAQETPYLLLSHVHTRYFGDLSGGQILAKKVKRAFNLPEHVGTAYYKFHHISSPNDFKVMCRQKLDAIPVTKAMTEALVQESVLAFSLVTNVYNELDASLQPQPAATAQKTTNSTALVIMMVETSLLIILFALYVTFREQIMELVFHFLNK